VLINTNQRYQQDHTMEIHILNNNMLVNNQSLLVNHKLELPYLILNNQNHHMFNQDLLHMLLDKMSLALNQLFKSKMDIKILKLENFIPQLHKNILPKLHNKLLNNIKLNKNNQRNQFKLLKLLKDHKVMLLISYTQKT